MLAVAAKAELNSIMWSVFGFKLERSRVWAPQLLRFFLSRLGKTFRSWIQLGHRSAGKWLNFKNFKLCGVVLFITLNYN